MRDFPVFPSKYGVASLTLKEIPYKQEAYIRLQDTDSPEALLKECLDFCVLAGATKVYATGHRWLERYPVHTCIWKMRCLRRDLPKSDGELVLLDDRNLERWRRIYNEGMDGVFNAATMTHQEAKRICDAGQGYFVYRNGMLIGIGVAFGECVEAVISVTPGAGKDVFVSLCDALSGEWVFVEVSSQNQRGLKLYKKLDFTYCEEVSRWYKIK